MNLLRNKKLLILPIIIIASLLISSYIFFNQIERLKKQIDSLYFGAFIPVHKLHKIINAYNNIKYNNKITKQDKNEIINNWKYYFNSYKTQNEKKVLNNINTKINNSFLIYDKKLLLEIIKNLNGIIAYEIDVVHIERKNFILQYKQTNLYLEYSLAIILIVSLFFVIFIIYILMQKHSELELLNEKYKKDSITDSLSQLYNRKHFDNVFSKMTKIAFDNKWKCAFIMLDIDFFKPFNDTYGHDMGDMVIKNVANTLKKSFNKHHEYLFRIGGEEFGIIIFDTSLNTLEKSLDNLQDNIKSLNIPHTASSTGFLTVSMGVIIVDEHSSNMEVKELYKQADDKLYYSKEHGRNKYTI